MYEQEMAMKQAVFQQSQRQSTGAVLGAGYAGNCLSDAPKQTQVEAAMDKLSTLIDSTRESMNMLDMRLQSVSQPQPVTNETQNPRPPSSCALEGRIMDCSYSIAQIAQQLQAMCSALCV